MINKKNILFLSLVPFFNVGAYIGRFTTGSFPNGVKRSLQAAQIQHRSKVGKAVAAQVAASVTTKGSRAQIVSAQVTKSQGATIGKSGVLALALESLKQKAGNTVAQLRNYVLPGVNPLVPEVKHVLSKTVSESVPAATLPVAAEVMTPSSSGVSPLQAMRQTLSEAGQHVFAQKGSFKELPVGLTPNNSSVATPLSKELLSELSLLPGTPGFRVAREVIPQLPEAIVQSKWMGHSLGHAMPANVIAPSGFQCMGQSAWGFATKLLMRKAAEVPTQLQKAASELIYLPVMPLSSTMPIVPRSVGTLMTTAPAVAPSLTTTLAAAGKVTAGGTSFLQAMGDTMSRVAGKFATSSTKHLKELPTGLVGYPERRLLSGIVSTESPFYASHLPSVPGYRLPLDLVPNFVKHIVKSPWHGHPITCVPTGQTPLYMSPVLSELTTQAVIKKSAPNVFEGMRESASRMTYVPFELSSTFVMPRSSASLVAAVGKSVTGSAEAALVRAQEVVKVVAPNVAHAQVPEFVAHQVAQGVTHQAPVVAELAASGMSQSSATLVADVVQKQVSEIVSQQVGQGVVHQEGNTYVLSFSQKMAQHVGKIYASLCATVGGTAVKGAEKVNNLLVAAGSSTPPVGDAPVLQLASQDITSSIVPLSPSVPLIEAASASFMVSNLAAEDVLGAAAQGGSDVIVPGVKEAAKVVAAPMLTAMQKELLISSAAVAVCAATIYCTHYKINPFKKVRDLFRKELIRA